MNRTLLDTDILSEILKGRDQNVANVASDYLREHRHFTLSAVTVFEITRGYRRVKRDSKLESFERALLACDVLPFDDPAARIAGRMYAELELSGRTVGMPDVMIAAIAVRNGLAIATGNVAHFEAIRGVGHELEIFNWRTWRPT